MPREYTWEELTQQYARIAMSTGKKLVEEAGGSVLSTEIMGSWFHKRKLGVDPKDIDVLVIVSDLTPLINKLFWHPKFVYDMDIFVKDTEGNQLFPIPHGNYEDRWMTPEGYIELMKKRDREYYGDDEDDDEEDYDFDTDEDPDGYVEGWDLFPVKKSFNLSRMDKL